MMSALKTNRELQLFRFMLKPPVNLIPEIRPQKDA